MRLGQQSLKEVQIAVDIAHRQHPPVLRQRHAADHRFGIQMFVHGHPRSLPENISPPHPRGVRHYFLLYHNAPVFAKRAHAWYNRRQSNHSKEVYKQL